MTRRRLSCILTALLAVVLALACGFLFACNNGEDDFDPEALVGTWSNPEIVAKTDFMTVTEATAAVEFVVNEDHTLSVEIGNIYVEFQGYPIDEFRSIEMKMTGTWDTVKNDYVLKLDNNENVTYEEGGELKIAPVRGDDGEVFAVKLSFSIEYHVDFLMGYGIPISMTDAMLYAGPLER